MKCFGRLFSITRGAVGSFGGTHSMPLDLTILLLQMVTTFIYSFMHIIVDYVKEFPRVSLITLSYDG